jgi:hypothetical protein
LPRKERNPYLVHQVAGKPLPVLPKEDLNLILVSIRQEIKKAMLLLDKKNGNLFLGWLRRWGNLPHLFIRKEGNWC